MTQNVSVTLQCFVTNKVGSKLNEVMCSMAMQRYENNNIKVTKIYRILCDSTNNVGVLLKCKLYYSIHNYRMVLDAS